MVKSRPLSLAVVLDTNVLPLAPCIPQERDPVEHVKKLLMSKGFEAADFKPIEKAVKKEVDGAVQAAKVSWAWCVCKCHILPSCMAHSIHITNTSIRHQVQ